MEDTDFCGTPSPGVGKAAANGDVMAEKMLVDRKRLDPCGAEAEGEGFVQKFTAGEDGEEPRVQNTVGFERFLLSFRRRVCVSVGVRFQPFVRWPPPQASRCPQRRTHTLTLAGTSAVERRNTHANRRTHTCEIPAISTDYESERDPSLAKHLCRKTTGLRLETSPGPLQKSS